MASTTNTAPIASLSESPNSGFRYVEGSQPVNLLQEISMPLAETSILGGVKCWPVDHHQAVGRCWRQCDVACGKVLLQSYSVQCIYDDRRHGRGVHPNLRVLLVICTSTLLNCYPWLCGSACTGCCWGCKWALLYEVRALFALRALSRTIVALALVFFSFVELFVNRESIYVHGRKSESLPVGDVSTSILKGLSFFPVSQEIVRS
jgi:hypothetical protein